MDSVVSCLDLERERQLLTLFPEPVRLHLLLKATKGDSSFLRRFNMAGQFIFVVYLSSGAVRGAYLSKPPQKDADDKAAFLFDITAASAIKVRQKVNNEAVKFGYNCLAFGTAFQLLYDVGFHGQWKVCLSSDEVFKTGWSKESFQINSDRRLIDVELFRVQSIGDVMPSPWREMSWTDNTRDDLRERFLSHGVAGECVSSARVLLLGPVGAGKSSFINSIRSVMLKRITHMVASRAGAPNRFQKLKSCSIRSGSGGGTTSLILCDVCAVGEDEAAGLSISDALAVVKGHIPEGYRFQADKPITSETPGYRAAPVIGDTIHAVLFVLDAQKVSSYSSHLQETMRELQVELSDLDIPQLVLLTHVDLVCHAVQEDLQFVFRSRPVKDKMHEAAKFLSMPVSYVLAVKNYASEHSTSCHTDILLLRAVDTVLQAIDDTLDDQCATTSTTSSSCASPTSTTDNNTCNTPATDNTNAG